MSAVLEAKIKEDAPKLTLLEQAAMNILASLSKPNFLEILKRPFGQYHLSPHQSYQEYQELLKIVLFELIKRNRIIEVDYLLSLPHERLLECRDKEGNTPIIVAAGYASGRMVDYLFRKGANLLTENYKAFNVYLMAVYKNNKDVIKYLEADHSSNFYKPTSNGATVFFAAALAGNSEFMEHYSKKTGEIDFLRPSSGLGFKALMLAAKAGSMPILEWGLNKDKDILKKKNPGDGLTLFHSAAIGNSIPAMEWMLNKDKSVLDVVDGFGNTCFINAAAEGSIAAMEYLLELNPQFLNQCNKNGRNALHRAAKEGRLPTIKFLLSKGVKLNVISQSNQTEMDLAKEYNHMEIVVYLSTVKDIFDYICEGRINALIHWKASGNSLNFKDSVGNNLLYYAIKENQLKIVLYLLEQGLSIDNLNAKGETVFQAAIKKGAQIEVIWPIFEYLADKKEEIRIAALRREFSDLIQYADNLKLKLDFDYLALKYDRKYWLEFAKDAASKDACRSKKEKLSHLIYTGIILCKENKDGSVSFELPKREDKLLVGIEETEIKEKKEMKEKMEPSLDMKPILGTEASLGIETSLDMESTGLIESDEERRTRLFCALKFAMEAEDFRTAMRISIEMTSEKATLPEVHQASEAVKDVKSKDGFFLMYMRLNYKSKLKETLKKVNSSSQMELEPKGLDCD